MKRYPLAILALAAILSVFTTSGYAAVTTTTYLDQATWNPVALNGSAQIDQTTTTPQATAVNNAGLVLGPNNRVMVQTFTPTTSFTLGAFGIYAAGGPVTGASIHLFQTTIAPASWATTGGFNPAANSTGIDLFNPANTGTGLTFNYFGTATQNYLEFDLSGGSQIALTADVSYDLEIWSPSDAAANSLFWRRSSTDIYANGNAYARDLAAGYAIADPGLQTSRNDISGAGRRDGALVLYAVPEPSSCALLGMGALFTVTWFRRRAA